LNEKEESRRRTPPVSYCSVVLNEVWPSPFSYLFRRLPLSITNACVLHFLYLDLYSIQRYGKVVPGLN